MINFVLSLIFCTIPDTIYYAMFISIAKNKNFNKKLYFLIFIGYIIFNMICVYNLYLYLLFYLYIYFALKIIYKSQINDFFLIVFIDFYYLILSSLCYFLVPNYLIAYLINKILLFFPLIFKDKLKKLYSIYTKLWNKNKEAKQPIKSITLRNISLVLLNVIIVISDILLIYLSLNNS